MVENAVGITVQRSLRRQLAAAQGHAPGTEVRYSATTEVALGGATGVFTALAICPFEVLKVRQQVQSDSGLFKIVRQLVREDGYGGFYRGLASVMCRDVVRDARPPTLSMAGAPPDGSRYHVTTYPSTTTAAPLLAPVSQPFNAIFYGAYESICTLMMSMQRLESKDELHPGCIFFAGGGSRDRRAGEPSSPRGRAAGRLVTEASLRIPSIPNSRGRGLARSLCEEATLPDASSPL